MNVYNKNEYEQKLQSMESDKKRLSKEHVFYVKALLKNEAVDEHVQNQIIKDILLKVPGKRSKQDLDLLMKLTAELQFFKSLTKQSQKICLKSISVLEYQHFRKGQNIFHKDDEPEFFYILISGSARVLLPKSFQEMQYEKEKGKLAYGYLDFKHESPIARRTKASITFNKLSISLSHDNSRLIEALTPSSSQSKRRAGHIFDNSPSSAHSVQMVNNASNQDNCNNLNQQDQSPTLNVNIQSLNTDNLNEQPPPLVLQPRRSIFAMNQFKSFQSGASMHNNESQLVRQSKKSIVETKRQTLFGLSALNTEKQDVEEGVKYIQGLRNNEIMGLSKYFDNGVFMYSMGNVLTKGNEFGERGLLTKRGKRTAGVVCLEDCHMAIMRKRDYKAILQEITQRKIQKRILFIKENFFMGIKEISYESVYNYSYWFHKKKFHAKQILFDEGEAPDFVYLIVKGMVELSCNSSNYDPLTEQNAIQFKKVHQMRQVKISTLSRGQVFGESEIIFEGKRHYKAQCLSDATLLALKASFFCKIMDERSDIEVHFRTRVINKMKFYEKQITSIENNMLNMDRSSDTLLLNKLLYKQETFRPIRQTVEDISDFFKYNKIDEMVLLENQQTTIDQNQHLNNKEKDIVQLELEESQTQQQLAYKLNNKIVTGKKYIINFQKLLQQHAEKKLIYINVENIKIKRKCKSLFDDVEVKKKAAYFMRGKRVPMTNQQIYEMQKNINNMLSIQKRERTVSDFQATQQSDQMQQQQQQGQDDHRNTHIREVVAFNETAIKKLPKKQMYTLQEIINKHNNAIKLQKRQKHNQMKATIELKMQRSIQKDLENVKRSQLGLSVTQFEQDLLKSKINIMHDFLQQSPEQMAKDLVKNVARKLLFQKHTKTYGNQNNQSYQQGKLKIVPLIGSNKDYSSKAALTSKSSPSTTVALLTTPHKTQQQQFQQSCNKCIFNKSNSMSNIIDRPTIANDDCMNLNLNSLQRGLLDCKAIIPNMRPQTQKGTHSCSQFCNELHNANLQKQLATESKNFGSLTNIFTQQQLQESLIKESPIGHQLQRKSQSQQWQDFQNAQLQFIRPHTTKANSKFINFFDNFSNIKKIMSCTKNPQNLASERTTSKQQETNQAIPDSNYQSNKEKDKNLMNYYFSNSFRTNVQANHSKFPRQKVLQKSEHNIFRKIVVHPGFQRKYPNVSKKQYSQQII